MAILRSGDGRSYEEDKRGNVVIRFFAHMTPTELERIKNDPWYRQFICWRYCRAGNNYLLLKEISARVDTVQRVLFYYVPGEDFYSVILLLKYPTQQVSAINMKKLIGKEVNYLYLFPFLINNFKPHESAENCTWDIDHAKIGPLEDIQGQDLLEFIQDESSEFSDALEQMTSLYEKMIDKICSANDVEGGA
jgi:hypothetical protein